MNHPSLSVFSLYEVFFLCFWLFSSLTPQLYFCIFFYEGTASIPSEGSSLAYLVGITFLYQSPSYFSYLWGFCLFWFLNNGCTFAKAFIDLSTAGNARVFFNAPDLWIALWAWGTAPCSGWITDCSGSIYFSKLMWTVPNLGAVRYNFCGRKAIIFADSLCSGIVH